MLLVPARGCRRQLHPPVDLFGKDDSPEFHAEGMRGALPVNDHALRIIADVQTQIQRRMCPLGHPTVPGAHRDDHAE